MSALFDTAPLRASPALRKALAVGLRLPRAVLRPWPPADATHTRPPVLVNSIPKSGTHLVLQLARALPETRYWGTFIATTPSLTLRPRTPDALARRLGRLLPGEVTGAHLFHSQNSETALRATGALHLFVCRDPRDVLLSEAHYLATMNRWHRMHRPFRRLDDPTARLRLAIEGFDARYPPCEQRLAPYLGWLAAPDTLVLRYEDFFGPARAKTLARISAAFASRARWPGDQQALAARLAAAIAPQKSHTFHTGGTQKWRTAYDPATLRRANQRLGPVLAALGYPES